MARRGCSYKNQSKQSNVPLRKGERGCGQRGLCDGQENRLSDHDPTATLPAQGKKLGKSNILGFRNPLYTKTPNSNPPSSVHRTLSSKYFYKEWVQHYSQNPHSNPAHSIVYKLLSYCILAWFLYYCFGLCLFNQNKLYGR